MGSVALEQRLVDIEVKTVDFATPLHAIKNAAILLLYATAYGMGAIAAVYLGIGIGFRYAWYPQPVHAGQQERFIPQHQEQVVPSAPPMTDSYQLRRELVEKGVVSKYGRINKNYAAEDTWCFAGRPCWRINDKKTEHKKKDSPKVQTKRTIRIIGPEE